MRRLHRIDYTVTLRMDWKSRSFCLSSVRGMLSNVAWPRLAAYRSGGGKARNQRIHSCIWLLGGARPVGSLMPYAKGRMAHNLRLAPGEKQHPPLSRLIPWERTHTAGGFSRVAILEKMRHFLNPWSGYPWLRASK